MHELRPWTHKVQERSSQNTDSVFDVQELSWWLGRQLWIWNSSSLANHDFSSASFSIVLSWKVQPYVQVD